MIYALVGALIGMVVVLISLIFIFNAKHFTALQELSVKHFDREQSWNVERQKLLDRIQAPSFSHFKEAEVKVIKAQKEEPKDTIKLEVV